MVPTPQEDLPREPLADPELCGRFAAWFAAALGNRVDTDSALAAIEAGSDGHVVTGWPDWRVDADGNDGVELIARLPDVGAVAVEFALADVVVTVAAASASARCRWCCPWPGIRSG